MNELRLWGDPFGDVAHSQALRGLLRLAIGSGMRCALSLTPVRPRAATAGERSVPLHDGARTFTVGTMLPATELELVQRAVAQPVAATAPVVVFAERAELRDQTLLAGLEWPVACKVVTALADTSSRELLERVRAELRWAGTEDPEHGCELAELRPWLQLPPPPAGGPILHLGADDPAAGTELLVRVFAEQLAARGQRLR